MRAGPGSPHLKKQRRKSSSPACSPDQVSSKHLPLPKPPGSGGLTMCPLHALPPPSLPPRRSAFSSQAVIPSSSGCRSSHQTSKAFPGDYMRRPAKFLGERLGSLEFGFFSYVTCYNMTDLYNTCIKTVSALSLIIFLTNSSSYSPGASAHLSGVLPLLCPQLSRFGGGASNPIY